MKSLMRVESLKCELDSLREELIKELEEEKSKINKYVRLKAALHVTFNFKVHSIFE